MLDREIEIAKAFGVPFDLDDPQSWAKDAAARLIVSTITEITSTERLIRQQVESVRNNLDRLLDTVDAAAGSVNCMGAVRAENLDSYVTQLSTQRRHLATMVGMLKALQKVTVAA